MAATLARAPWTAPAGEAVRSPWRFAQLIWVDGHAVLQWVLRRDGAQSPRRVWQAYLLLCAVSMVVAGAVNAHGRLPLLTFAVIELMLVGLMLLLYSRHATDCETITLRGESLVVEHHCGANVERAEFRSAWVCIEPRHNERSLLELSGQGQQMRVGRYLLPELRTPLAHELRRALRSESAQAGATSPESAPESAPT